MKLKVAVIAGTPEDTQLGVQYLNDRNEQAQEQIVETFDYPVSASCDEQIKFQYSDYREKRAQLDRIFDDAKSKGVQDFFIYCNSLSGAFDFNRYSIEKQVNIYTPLKVYAHLANRCRKRIGVIAANNLSAYKIEHTIMQENPDLYVLGAGMMQVVSAVEAKHSPKEIVEQCGLIQLLRYFEQNQCECLVLGCTHFPYFKEELKRHTGLQIVDPADEMYEEMMKNNNFS